MSMMPEPTPESAVSGEIEAPAFANPPRRGRWHGRIWSICFTLFTFEIGLFLTLFPWMESWSRNQFPSLFPLFQNIWDDGYLRGAVSGLGLVNLFIASRQVVRMIRRRS